MIPNWTRPNSIVMIASTQRMADYADWYDHWITAAV